MLVFGRWGVSWDAREEGKEKKVSSSPLKPWMKVRRRVWGILANVNKQKRIYAPGIVRCEMV